MKKNWKRILTILVVIIAVFMVLSFSACKKEEAQPSVSVSEEVEDDTEVKEEAKAEKEEPEEEKQEEEVVMESISFQLGNDIGQNIVALQIKPEEHSQWSDIALEKIWASGYMIPVTLQSEDLPEGAEWEISVTFDDDTEETFKNVNITEGAELILVPGEVIY